VALPTEQIEHMVDDVVAPENEGLPDMPVA
jgi:hypothetical protein